MPISPHSKIPVAYARSMATALDGHPLVDGTPDQTFLEYAKEGVRLYDLCRLLNNGRLGFLYSLSSPYSHARNIDETGRSFAPIGYVPLQNHVFSDPAISAAFRRDKAGTPKTFYSNSIKSTTVGADVKALEYVHTISSLIIELIRTI